MEFRHLISFATVLLFLIYFFSGNKGRRSYALYVLFLFPFIDLTITNEKLGSFSVFDFLTYFTFIYFIKDLNINLKRDTGYLLLFFILTVLLVIGCLISEFPINSFTSLLKLLSIFIFVKYFIDECLKDSDFLRQALLGIKISVFISVVFLVIQIFIGVEFTLYPYLNQNIFDSNIVRYPSYFQDPQVYAQYLSIVSFLFLFRFDNGKLRVWDYLFFIVIVFVLFLTGGRSALLGMCIGSSFLVLISNTKFRVGLVLSGAFTYLVILTFPDAFSMFNRQETYNDAFGVRFLIWKEAFDVFLDNPFFGIGIGNYLLHVQNHSTGGYYIIDDEIVYYGTESGYLRILVEYGVFGFILFFAFAVHPAIRVIKSLRNSNTKFISGLFIASLLTWMTAYSTLNSLSDKRIFILVAIILSILYINNRKEATVHV